MDIYKLFLALKNPTLRGKRISEYLKIQLFLLVTTFTKKHAARKMLEHAFGAHVMYVHCTV